MKQNASQLAGAPGAVRGESFIRMRIKLAGPSVPFDGGVELLCVEGLKPRAKPHQLARGKLLDGFLNVFGSGHAGDIALGRGAEKDVGCNRMHQAAHVPVEYAASQVARSDLFAIGINVLDFHPAAGAPSRPLPRRL